VSEAAPSDGRRVRLVMSEGGPKTTKTHCPYCAFQCGMSVTTSLTPAGADAFDVRADPDFPVNLGQMCIKGFTSAALLDHPARRTTPRRGNPLSSLK